MKKFYSYALILLSSFLLSGLSCFRNNDDNNGPVYDERNISRNEGLSSAPRVSIDISGNVHIVWKDNTEGEWQVYYRERDGDSEWGEIVDLTGSECSSMAPDIATDNNGNLYVVWPEECGNEREIDFAERVDGEWSEPISISGASGIHSLPAVSVDESGDIYVSWMGDFGGISFRKRVGEVWNSRVDISETFGWENPMMFVEGDGKVHIVTDHGEICYFYSLDGGESWNKEMVVDSAFQDTYYDWVGDVVAVDDKVYVVWTRSKYGEGIKGLYMTIKDTNGVWGEPGKLPGPESAPNYGTINSDGSYLYLTWREWVDGQDEVYLARKEIGGEWENSINVSNTSTNSITRGYDISNGVVYIAWFEKLTDNNWDIYFDEVNP